MSSKELAEMEKLILKHTVAYCWATSDNTIRPPVSLKFKESKPTPITDEARVCLRK